MHPYHFSKLAPSDDPRRVVVKKMSFVSKDRELELDLTGMYWLFYLF